MDTHWEHIDDAACRRFLGWTELVGQRWNSAILLALTRGAERYTDILGMIPGLSERLLSARLTQLAAAGLVIRTVVPTTPVQIRYGLTESGRGLMESLQPLAEWGQQWAAGDELKAG